VLAFRVAGLALLAALLLVPAAQASFPSSVEMAVAPGGNASIASPTLSSTMKSATVDVAPAEPSQEQFFEQVHPLAVLMLSSCLELAAQIDQAAQTQPLAMSGAAKCNRMATQVGATFTRVGRKYRAEISGTPTKLAQRGRLKVTCKRKGAGFAMKVRPTAKGKSLRSVVGPRLRMGVYNPLAAEGSGRVKVTFRR